MKTVIRRSKVKLSLKNGVLHEQNLLLAKILDNKN